MATAVAIAAVAATVISTGVAVYSASQQADAAEAEGQAQYNAAVERANAANNAATQLEQQAGQTRAAAQRKAIADRQNAALVQSRARALFAASGGTSTDPSAVNITGQLGARGEYNALIDLYNGEESAQGMDYQATLDRATGQSDISAGQFSQGIANQRAGLFPIQAAGTILGAAGGLYAKYGAGATNAGPTADEFAQADVVDAYG